MPGTDTSIWICSRNEKADVSRRPPKLPQARRRQSVSEAVHPAQRYRLQGRASEAGTRSTAILAIGGNAVAARAEVVVRAGVIGLAGIHGIPVALPVEIMLVSDRVHVGHVIDRTRARITRRLPRMRPSEVNVVLTRDFLSQRQPRAVALPFVEVRIGCVAGHPLEDHVDYSAGGDRVLDAHLHRLFIGNGNIHSIVTGAVGLLV